ncbi:hypothetical protein RRG08_033843 [Elysia crispata]|uniref:Uncharacterized protein n=1 Tax=Elysia crispata TaxID=231223 RepID=A0AAE1B9Y8_9GAST|nr:hypothetical protein RRG08_033843 [Elysia crispata]
MCRSREKTTTTPHALKYCRLTQVVETVPISVSHQVRNQNIPLWRLSFSSALIEKAQQVASNVMPHLTLR